MLQSSVLPGTSTPHPMQGDGTISAMIEPIQTRSQTCSPRGLTARWRGLRTAAAIALVCAALGGCAGEQFQKGYVLPPGALEQIPIGASQDQVLIVMGTPSTVATLSGEVFYYISQRSSRPVAFMNEQDRRPACHRDLFRQEPPGAKARQLRAAGRQDLRLHQPHHADIRPGGQLRGAAVQGA